MPNPPFVDNLIYHIYNRGVDKRTTFQDKDDYFRFIHNLYEFNDEQPADNIYYKSKHYKSHEVSLRKNRKCLVEILAYVLMPNHYHLMVRQITDAGITEFMRKIGTGYTNYFNLKHERSGVLFQGKFKAVLLEHDTHFTYLPYYIHLNPLDLYAPEWRNGRIDDPKGAWNRLNRYRWSSHPDYSGIKAFPSVLHMNLLRKALGQPKEYERNLKKYIGMLHSASAPLDVYLE